MNNSLKDEVAVITGGNAGIGKAISMKFAEAGANVIILGTNPQTGQATISEILEKFPFAKVGFYPVNIEKTSDVDQILQEILQKEGKIDILVNNAGVTDDQLLLKMSEEQWDRVMSINLKGCFNTCRAVVRSMIKSRKGKIINISSVVGLTGNKGQANYAASKAGMIGFTKALAKELTGRNREILVNCIAPGFINTKMTEDLSDEQKQEILNGIPLGRMGDPIEIANVAWFLASPLSTYMTGQVLAVDGGMVM